MLKFDLDHHLEDKGDEDENIFFFTVSSFHQNF